MSDVTVEAFMTLLSSRLKMDYTEEQLALMKDFTKSKICFADPGTGKTATATAGLLVTELYRSIPGENIYALSFTKMATMELAVRHKKACDKLGIPQYVNFQTLHSLCTTILYENYRLLGLESFKTSSTFSIESIAKLIQDSAAEKGIKLSPYKVRPVIRAVRSLNSSLIFDRDNVESKMCFKETGLSFEDFTTLRKILYDYNKLVEIIQVDDILLYTLELLTTHPEVSEQFKKKCKVMLVDEAQDLSLLQLRLISLLADKAVLIGDLKQQIYAFNGACQEIVEQFFKFYPDATSLKLTQSFRCKNEIANYATGLIIHNGIGGEDFKGTGEGGSISVDADIDLSALCDNIEKDFHNNNNTFPDSILFLFRNNFSAIPVAEELYKRRIPFRVNNYVGANNIPVIKEMCQVVELANNPTTYSNATALRYLIPEFKGYRSTDDIPIVKIAKKQGCSIFDVNYSFQNEYVGNSAMELLLSIQEALNSGTKLKDIFNMLWPLYYERYLKDREPYLEYKPDYYINLVQSLVREKTYQQFGKDELAKVEFIKNNEDRRFGVRCYTCHAAKGLEADIVHFIDADEGILPNESKLKDMLKKGCEMDAAREIRNERSLVYVSATRAKREFHIHFNARAGLAPILTGVNTYKELDRLYKVSHVVYDDVKSFTEFYGG